MFDVGEGWLCVDGFFSSVETSDTPAPDIAGFTRLWLECRPDPDSIVLTVWPKQSSDRWYDYGVVATDGKNGRGFDSTIGVWEAEFSYSAERGVWDTVGFYRRSVTIPR